MEIENDENITLLPCRACMQFTSTMYPLFEEYEAGISMASILKSYLSSEIISQAKLPNQLCEDCAVTLIKFHNFIVIYRDTQNKFDKWQECAIPTDENFIDTDVKNISLENEQIIIQSVGADNYCLEIKSEIAKDDYQYFEDGVQNTKRDAEFQESAEIEETINISFEEGDEFNSEPNNYHLANDSNSQDTTENVIQYHCPYCSDIFLYKELLNGHVNKSHKIFKSADILANTTLIKRRIFIENDANNSNYISENSSAMLYQHLCKLCGRSFPTIKSLQIHRSSHKRNKKYTIANGANPEEILFICDVCGRSFKKKAYLNDHIEIHDSVRKLHSCPICHKQFKGRSNFARHKRFHFQAKKQQICEVCGIGFNLRSTLKTHFYLKHVQERNFQCLICFQFFSLKSTLEKHVRRHLYREGSAQAVKFACFACDMKYLDKSSLKRHVELKHSEDNNRFKCVDCDKDYTTYTNLAKHRMKQHPEKPLQDGRKKDTPQLHLLDDVIATIIDGQ